MEFTVDGVVYTQPDMERLTFAEIDAMERACGMTMAEIQRKGMTCVCEHYTAAHPQTDDGTACIVCGCPEFSSVVPSKVQTAGLWVAMRRSNPTLTFEQVANLDAGSFEFEEVPKDLSGDLPEGSPTAGTPTSEPSPTSSGSTPGTSTG